MPTHDDDNALDQAQAAALVKAAVKNGLAPDRRHLDTAFGPVLGAEIGALIRRKQSAEAKELARRISRRTAETQDRTPVAGADIDLEKAIQEAIAEAKAKPSSHPEPAETVRNSEKESTEPESVDPRAVLAEWEARRKQGSGTGHYHVRKFDQHGPFVERVDSTTHLPTGRF
ncbi:hypothetical protein ACFYY3_08300 [Streptomyces sp. NPDC001812]|uniref:hypothetical protein n=1 Tax=Streptomyces sp. NPDC001812 TaxID=3364611 RepID=UPI0036B1CC84